MRRAAIAATIAVLLALLVPLAAAQDDLDGREANVLGVDWANTTGGTTLWVTLYKELEQYDGIGDWWQIEDLDGNVVGSKQVDQNETHYTSNTTITVPPGIRYLVVRAHDSAYGFGGQAVVVDLDGDFTAYDQGSEPTMFQEPGSGDGSGESEKEPDATGGVPITPSAYNTSRGELAVPDDDITLPENVTGEDWRIPQVSQATPWMTLLVAGILLGFGIALYLRRR